MSHGLHAFTLACFLSLLLGSAVKAAELAEVFVDGRDPAYVVVQGIAVDTPSEAWQEMEGYAQLRNVSLVSWIYFRKNAQAVLAPYVRRDDYPNGHVPLGIVTLVKKYPGRPFAVTWNGGVAVTFFDYQYAAETHQKFLSDPIGYENALPLALEDDPVNPKNQLPRLLNR